MYTYLVCKEKVIPELTYSLKPKTAFFKCGQASVHSETYRAIGCVTRYMSCSETYSSATASGDNDGA